MRYPMTNNWLSYRRISHDEYSVHDNLDGSVYTMGYRVARFAKCLNGKRDPYGIDPTLSTKEVKSMLLDLSEHNLLRTNRVLTSSFGTFLYTLWIPRWTKFLRLVACLMNCVLLLLWFPILFIGCYVFAKNLLLIDVDFSVGGHIVGLVCGICCHELAHAFAGISYNAKVFEFGIGFQSFLPCAYTMMECSECRKMHKVQINAAGIESNMLLTGLFLMFGAMFPNNGAFLFSAALCNFILGIINMLCLEGLDGMGILSDLIGVDASEFLEKSKRVVRSPKRRKKLQAKGFSGYATIMMSYIVVVSQIGFPVLLLINIWGVIECFV